MKCNSRGCTFYFTFLLSIIDSKKEVGGMSGAISYKAKTGSKKLDSFFGKVLGKEEEKKVKEE